MWIRVTYEEAQRAFHAELGIESACFRVSALPFDRGSAGYEDWYLVERLGSALGVLNEHRRRRRQGPAHDRAASGSPRAGWGGLYMLVRRAR